MGKKAFFKQLEMPLSKAYFYTSKMMTLNMMAMDAKEGISAFLEKRKPKWKNSNEKEFLIFFFFYYWNSVIYNFKDHNQKRAIEACVAGSKTLEKPMTASEARLFCEKQIKNN
ncbi:MAG: hypothetical protein Ct9H90mP22_7420 [Gammaproteobacteria bacterium]|nr:MAG: hypothetical protein Ct9H90mP22_7420 [Gammaproteobacteria bacterium]